MNTKLIKNLILIAVLVGAAVLFYTFVIAGNLSSFLFVSSERRIEQTAVVRDLLNLRKDLEGLLLNTEFIDGEVFRALKDRTIILTPEQRGRRNPFQAP